jgi:hypothetical protein
MIRNAKNVAEEQFSKSALEPVEVSVYDDRFLVQCSEIAMYRILSSKLHRMDIYFNATTSGVTYSTDKVQDYGFSVNLDTWYIIISRA